MHLVNIKSIVIFSLCRSFCSLNPHLYYLLGCWLFHHPITVLAFGLLQSVIVSNVRRASYFFSGLIGDRLMQQYSWNYDDILLSNDRAYFERLETETVDDYRSKNEWYFGLSNKFEKKFEKLNKAFFFTLRGRVSQSTKMMSWWLSGPWLPWLFTRVTISWRENRKEQQNFKYYENFRVLTAKLENRVIVIVVVVDVSFLRTIFFMIKEKSTISF